MNENMKQTREKTYYLYDESGKLIYTGRGNRDELKIILDLNGLMIVGYKMLPVYSGFNEYLSRMIVHLTNE